MKHLSFGTIVVLIVLGLFALIQYNSISAKDEAVRRAWTPLASALELRYAQLPALDLVIRTYTQREDAISKALLENAKKYTAAAKLPEKATVANELEVGIDQLLVKAGQSYPGLESYFQYQTLAKNFQDSQQSMTAVLAGYNDAVDKYNTRIRDFPMNAIAFVCGFKRAVYIQRGGITK